MEQLEDQQNLSTQLNTRERSKQSGNSNKDPPISNSKLCSFYSNYGFCKFGQNCKFLHRRKYSYKTPVQRKSTPQSNGASLKLPQKKEKYADTISKEFNANGITYKNSQKRVCRYYKAGQCEKGENCLYNHNLDNFNIFVNVTLSNDKKDHVANGNKINVSKKKSIPLCRYFRHGSCQKGDQCKFYHNPKYQKEQLNISSNINENNLSSKKTEYNAAISSNVDSMNLENAEDPVHTSKLLANHENSETLQEFKHLNINNDTATNNIQIQIPQNSRVFNLSTLSEDGLCQLRNTEITQLKKRFPKVIENGSAFAFDFEPSDPDWPFDMKSLHLQVTFPESYPLEVCDITVVSHMNYLPGVLLRHLNQSICDWLIEKHQAAIEQNQVVLLFRPFLKWFDKNLEEFFNFGLKKVTDEGTQNVDNESVLPERKSPVSCENSPENDISGEESSLSSNIPSIPSDSEKERNHSPIRQKAEPSVLNNLQMQGSKIIFTGLEFVEGVAALSCKKLSITIHCSRCKTSCNKILIPNKNTPMLCSKCSKSMECNFNPSILHQFSSVLGTIYLMECQAADVNLVECAFLVDCLSCAKQVSVDGLHYGQKQKLWCKFCNQKLTIGIESVKFQTSAATAVTTSNKTVAVKKVTKKKDPVIKEGCPLPDYGACKHYKKSYRWLRFPCCGRLYPCDLCHDEKEDDHDMKYASRMVCGFCSKEQPYSKEKPCFGCSANMTKKSGSYWEGGQGCRNSVTMSRKDAHKFAGMSKTTSKKSQPTGKKKK
ncbi:uncharacterized protein LOC129961699 isoform X2 [Argiope bruennichi]|uniref:uncharacterized protein LOC129961699 isoform X2 n=1 Tax=Argiope bruennichi TaxID=94029 RepID=UPI0024950972|nr:uncharacterized protein LOC129961699 isoform X2 [Argiope bruennichi]